jgi:hypothetical protein
MFFITNDKKFPIQCTSWKCYLDTYQKPSIGEYQIKKCTRFLAKTEGGKKKRIEGAK